MALTMNKTYRLESKLKSGQVLDISGGSTSDGANAQLYAFNGTDAQVLLVGGTQADATMTVAVSGKRIDVSGGVATSGRNVQQWTANSTSAQSWSFVDAGTSATINGESLPYYYVKSKLNATYVLDAAAGQNANGTNLQLWESNNTDAQKWLAIPTPRLDSKLPVPASIGFATEATGSARTTIAADGTVTLYPTWTCDHDAFQMRYRWRGRAANGTMGGWSSWTSPTGVTTHEGWGSVWAANVTPSDTGKVKHAGSVSVPFAPATNDMREYQIEVRAFHLDGSWPCVGNSSTATVKIVQKPTITVSGVTFTGGYLRVSYATNLKRVTSNVSVTKLEVSDKVGIYSNALTGGAYVQKGAAVGGSVDIPVERLAYIPSGGSSCQVSIEVTSAEGQKASASYSGTVSNTGGSGMTCTLNVTAVIGTTYLNVAARPSKTANKEQLVMSYVQGGRTVTVPITQPAPSGAPHVFIAYPPFGKQVQVMYSVESGADWAVDSKSVKATSDSAPHVSFDGSDIALRTFTEVAGGFTRSVEPDSESYQTNGREYESVFFGKGDSSEISMTVAADHGTLDMLRRLERARYCVLRMPSGDRFECALTGYEEKIIVGDYTAVSLTFKERS